MSAPQQPLLQIECYAGHRAEEEPRSISIGGRSITFDTIIERWLASGHRCFKGRGCNDETYILPHDARDDPWELIMYDSGRASETRLSST